MSLLKRLWISVVVAMGVVLAGAFAVSLLTARSYFEQQLQAQASDGAVSLALSCPSKARMRRPPSCWSPPCSMAVITA